MNEKIHAYELKQNMHGYSREDLEELWNEGYSQAVEDIYKIIEKIHYLDEDYNDATWSLSEYRKSGEAMKKKILDIIKAKY